MSELQEVAAAIVSREAAYRTENRRAKGLPDRAALLPDGFRGIDIITSAEVIYSRRGMPMVRCKLSEHGFTFLGPLEYAQLSHYHGKLDYWQLASFDLKDIWAIWRYLSFDPSFLVGTAVSFRVKHVIHNETEYATFRVRKPI